MAAAEAQTPPKGRTLRLGMRCQDLKSPHTYSWIKSANAARQVCDYLAVTGINIAPGFVESWEASPDLKTWTLRIRRNVKWHGGQAFQADDAVWNLKRILDAKTGSSTVGLMKGFILEEYETGEKNDKGDAGKKSRASGTPMPSRRRIRRLLRAPESEDRATSRLPGTSSTIPS